MNNYEQRINQQISFEKATGELGTELSKAADVARRIKETSPNAEDEYLGTKVEGELLEKYAKEKNLWFDDYKKVFIEEPIGSGVEADVFISDDGKDVYKVNGGIQHPNWDDFFNRILAHNKYFPDYKYDLIGFTQKESRLAVILKQPVVAIKRSATPSEIKDDLEKRGFIFKGINDVRDIENGIIIRDLHRENAVINELDNIAYIDPLIQFEKDSHFLADIRKDTNLL